MAGGHEPPLQDKPSAKYRCGSLRGGAFEIVDYGHVDHDSAPTADKQRSRNPERRDSQICSTRELISALGSIWDHVTGPLSILVPKTTSRSEISCLKECNIFWHYSEGRTCGLNIAFDNQNHPINWKTSWDSLPVVRGHLGFIKVKDKISFVQPSIGVNSIIVGFCHGNDLVIQEPLKERSIGLECQLCRAYGWMTEMSYQKHLVSFTGIGKHDDSDSDLGLNSNDPANSSIYVGGSDGATNVIVEHEDSHSQKTSISVDQYDDPSSMKASSVTLWTNNEHERKIEVCSSEIPNSSLCADSLVSLVPCRACEFDEHESSSKADLEGNRINHQLDFAAEKKSELEVCFLVKEKPHRALAKQEHAFAGAMAGIFVSLSLHPLDTVKTVVQSCHTDQRSLLDICRSIISQRGITGLYRGISTNIASSAPISAVYTFTYESMKGILIPFLPTDYQSVAHGMAGGCASIATSFIFTPSERIKQQMQVSSRYQNCWNAFVGIIAKGGLPSLYAGWAAVLCRNVPHSIIKFYTYESMKQLLSSARLDGQTNTVVTLVSGGLAASTAALFTTPFDVVKTRLQTRIPGSLNRYPGIFDTLKDIAKNEGLKGLYRGLTPRLFMYMTQGGLFFTSYESFKMLFSLEGSRINISSHRA